jgi:hypothetical protein
MPKDERVRGGRKSNCSVRVVFNEHSDRHSRWCGGAEVGVDAACQTCQTARAMLV